MVEQETVITQRGREVLMMGNLVAVCWNGKWTTPTLTASQGTHSVVKTWQRNTERFIDPYIDFVWLRKDSKDGEMYEDDDSPITGGLGPDIARYIIVELTRAIDYIEAL